MINIVMKPIVDFLKDDKSTAQDLKLFACYLLDEFVREIPLDDSIAMEAFSRYYKAKEKKLTVADLLPNIPGVQ